MRTATVFLGLGVVTGLMVLSACGADDGPVAERARQRAECEPQEEGAFPLMAALAITMGFELQRWEATTDLEFRGNRLQLSETALERCIELGIPRCDNTRAILDFQDAQPLIVNDEVLFDPERYRQLLKQYFLRQMVADRLPCAHRNASWCAAHTLAFDHSEPGPCSIDYFFAIDATVPERCAQESARGGRTHRCRDLDTDPTGIVSKLTFAGHPENGFLDPDFVATNDATLIGIDPPLFAMIEGETIPLVDGCVQAVAVYDPDGKLAGACCNIHDVPGTLSVSSWNRATLVCR